MKTREPTAQELQSAMFSTVDTMIKAVRSSVNSDTITKERGAAVIDRLLDVRSEAVALAPSPRRRKAVAT